MPVEVTKVRKEDVVVASFFGQLTESDVTQAIRTAFATGHAVPGVDRIVIIEATAELHEIDSSALRRIQECVHKEELGGGAEVSFRSVIVCSSPVHRPLLELYKAIWDEHALPRIEFRVADSVAQAWQMLGRAPPHADNPRK